MSAILAPSLRFRRMQQFDLKKIIEIETAAYQFPWTQQIFSDCLRVGYQAQVLERQQQIISYGLMSLGAGEAHLLNLCVDPDYHNCGYGRLMLSRLLRLAKQHQTDSIFLEVRPSNQAAIKLYLKMGFNQVGVRHNYYPLSPKSREDALIFALTL
ncbi:MAG: ribosomal protein S18-alanine N-acetyltransferase [Pseudomonadota bacterium]|nr:ribosomal protein S18-alanine N-acetyltransferase [Pseudomonadota bacterium]